MTMKNGVGISEHTPSNKIKSKLPKNSEQWNRLGSHKRKLQNLRVSEARLENKFGSE
jgi:hypothetical protein